MATIPQITDRLEAATEKAEDASRIMHDVANGDASTEVPTESGPTPSVKKWFQDLGSEVEPMLAGIPARLDKAILTYPDYPTAQAAAATLPDWQLIDVESEQKRYRVRDSQLEFDSNFLRKDLSLSNGTSLIGSGSQSLQQHLDMLYFGVANIRDPQFSGGAKGTWDGASGDDDTAAIQAAVNSGARVIQVPPLQQGFSYRLTSPITISGNVRIIGSGASPYTTGIGTRGPGSWFHFDHGGRGLVIMGDGFLSGVELDGIGTLRTQPVPSPGWEPADHDYDIYIDNADVIITGMMLLNPTRGIFLTNGDAGRLEINTLRGHAFKNMLKVELSYDVVKINNLHQWPFWSDNPVVHAYTLQNLDVIHFARTDNPMLLNVFTIFARSGLRFSQSEVGRTSKVHLVNADFDRGKIALWVDGSVVNGVTGQFVNTTYQWETGLADSRMILIEGNFSELDFVNTRSDGCSDGAVEVGGSGNKLNFSGGTIARYFDQAATNKPAILCNVGNLINIDGSPDIQLGGGSGGKYGGLGDIRVNEWRDFVPSVTAETGSIVGFDTINGQFKRYGNSVDVDVNLKISNNGTGAGAIVVTLPNSAINMAVGVGRETDLSGVALTASVNAGQDKMQIRKYDNSYPAGDGARLIASVSYRI